MQRTAMMYTPLDSVPLACQRRCPTLPWLIVLPLFISYFRLRPIGIVVIASRRFLLLNPPFPCPCFLIAQPLSATIIQCLPLASLLSFTPIPLWFSASFPDA